MNHPTNALGVPSNPRHGYPLLVAPCFGKTIQTGFLEGEPSIAQFRVIQQRILEAPERLAAVERSLQRTGFRAIAQAIDKVFQIVRHFIGAIAAEP